jgi:hypothetical protein
MNLSISIISNKLIIYCNGCNRKFLGSTIATYEEISGGTATS